MSDDAVIVEDVAGNDGSGDRCKDFDDDCADVVCKLTCWLYDPGQGLCPYLTGEIRE